MIVKNFKFMYANIILYYAYFIIFKLPEKDNGGFA